MLSLRILAFQNAIGSSVIEEDDEDTELSFWIYWAISLIGLLLGILEDFLRSTAQGCGASNWACSCQMVPLTSRTISMKML